MTQPDMAARQKALGEWEWEWAQPKLASSPFHPEPAGSDYNQHYADLEVDDDEYWDRANQIMGVSREDDGQDPADDEELLRLILGPDYPNN